MTGWLLLLLGLAHADPADALAPYPRSLYLEARAEEEAEDYEAAARLYAQVQRLDPAFTHAVLGEARAREAAGDVDGAIEAYQSQPFDADAVRALGLLYLEEERFDAALQTFERLWPLTSHDPDALRLQVEALAHIDASEAGTRFREYAAYDEVDPADPEVMATATAVAESLEAAGEDVRALELLEDLAEDADEVEDHGYRDVLERLRVRRDARLLASSGAEPLTGVQRDHLEEARAVARAGDLARGEQLLRELVEQAPRSARTRAALADVLEQRGDIAGAEVEAFLATQLDPLESDHLVRYGDLLAEHHGGRLDGDAAQVYERALARQPGAEELWYRKGRVERRSGDLDAAVESWSTYLKIAPDGPRAAGLRAFLEDYERELPDLPELDSPPARRVNDEARLDFHIALVYQQQDRDTPDDPEAHTDLDRALFHVRRARERAPDFVAAYNLEAQLLLERGDVQAARAMWRESLTLDPEQPGVLVVLAEAERRLGNEEEADALLMKAAELGAADALYYQARAAVERGAWFEARSVLERYAAGGGSPLTEERARVLQEQVERRLLLMKLGGGGLAAGVLVLPAGLWVWRRSGATLDTLLERKPAAWRDVARIASAIRHEVLKHNITALDAVAAALEDRDPEPARWLAEKLYGPRGALARFEDYVQELEDVGLRYGVRLNLRRRDPVFGPLCSGMGQLQSLRGALEKGSGRRLSESLRGLSLELNTTAYGALGELVQRICVLTVERALLMDVWAEVRREPAFRDAGLVDFHVDLPDDEVMAVRIWRSDLEDILTNLLRNALSATLEHDAVRVGIRVSTEADPITGLEEVVIAVVDDAPRRITTAMIRGRYIERGLGLAVDLVSRNGGSVRVEDADGWTKAVAVRLPRAEEG